jgi:integrase
MGRPKVSIPKYGLHAPSGRAVVFIDRKPVYLGKHGSPESLRKYGEIIASQAVAPADEPSPEPVAAGDCTVNVLLLKFATEWMPKYLTSDGERSAEQDCFLGVIRILRVLFGETTTASFGPAKYHAARKAMIDKGWCRKFINKQCSRLRMIFQLGVTWEMVPLEVYQIIDLVPPLRYGDSAAPESIPREAVPPEDIDRVKAVMSERNGDILDLLLLTAARPGELLKVTTQMLDQTGDVWVADLDKHKTLHHGKRRAIHFGPRAQLILQKYLQPLRPFEKLFGIQRKTYSDAVKRACEKAKVTPFTPHHMRHTSITTIADEMDLESAQHVAGHSTQEMTLLYSRAAKKKARAAAKKLG